MRITEIQRIIQTTKMFVHHAVLHGQRSLALWKWEFKPVYSFTLKNTCYHSIRLIQVLFLILPSRYIKDKVPLLSYSHKTHFKVVSRLIFYRHSFCHQNSISVRVILAPPISKCSFVDKPHWSLLWSLSVSLLSRCQYTV